jgi:hypothetical protein
MLTLQLAMAFLEHAPPARPPIDGAPMGWTLADGATICNQCAGRIIDRGCQFNGTPIWDVPVECDAEAGSFALANDPPPLPSRPLREWRQAAAGMRRWDGPAPWPNGFILAH